MIPSTAAATLLQAAIAAKNLHDRNAQADSLVSFTRAARVEPILIMDDLVAPLSYTPDLLQTLLSVFTAYYMQAVALLGTVGAIKVGKVLEKLSPERVAYGQYDLQSRFDPAMGLSIGRALESLDLRIALESDQGAEHLADLFNKANEQAERAIYGQVLVKELEEIANAKSAVAAADPSNDAAARQAKEAIIAFNNARSEAAADNAAAEHAYAAYEKYRTEHPEATKAAEAAGAVPTDEDIAAANADTKAAFEQAEKEAHAQEKARAHGPDPKAGTGDVGAKAKGPDPKKKEPRPLSAEAISVLRTPGRLNSFVGWAKRQINHATSRAEAGKTAEQRAAQWDSLTPKEKADYRSERSEVHRDLFEAGLKHFNAHLGLSDAEIEARAAQAAGIISGIYTAFDTHRDFQNARLASRKIETSGSVSKAGEALSKPVNFAVGRVYDVTIKDGGHSSTIPVTIRFQTNVASPKTVVSILSDGARAHSATAKERAMAYRMGTLKFWRDIVMAEDMIQQHKQALIDDNSGLYETMTDRRAENRKRAIMTREPGVGQASSIAVLSDSTAKDLEKSIGAKLSNFDARERVFKSTCLMLMAVVYPELDMVKLYTRGIRMASDLSPRDLKAASGNSGGVDVAQMLQLLQQGHSPVGR